MHGWVYHSSKRVNKQADKIRLTKAKVPKKTGSSYKYMHKINEMGKVKYVYTDKLIDTA